MSFSKSNPTPFIFTENGTGLVFGIAAFSFISLSIWVVSRENEEKTRKHLVEDDKLKLKIRKDVAEQDENEEYPVSRKGHPQKSPRSLPSTPRKGQENLLQIQIVQNKLPSYHMIRKLQTTVQELREIEQLINRRKQDIEEQKMDNNVLQQRLQAEEQLRKEAEYKSSMIQIELERLQRKLSKHNVECLNLQQTLTAYKIDLELRRASMDAGDESAKKVQKLVSTLRDEHQRTKSEMLQLRDTNKTLLHKSAHDLNQRDQLLRQITDLKKQIKELKAASKAIESDQDELSDHNTPRGHFDVTFSTEKHRTIGDGYEEDEDAVDIPNATDNNDNDENDDELASDRFLRLYERHQTPRTTSW